LPLPSYLIHSYPMLASISSIDKYTASGSSRLLKKYGIGTSTRGRERPSNKKEENRFSFFSSRVNIDRERERGRHSERVRDSFLPFSPYLLHSSSPSGKKYLQSTCIYSMQVLIEVHAVRIAVHAVPIAVHAAAAHFRQTLLSLF
jgi:hypothetical protein